MQKKDICEHHAPDQTPVDPAALHTYINGQIEHLSGELAQRRTDWTVGGVDPFPATAAPWQLQVHTSPIRDPIPPPPTLQQVANDDPFTLTGDSDIYQAVIPGDDSDIYSAALP